MNPPPAEGLASRIFLGPALRTQPDRRLVTLVREGYESAFEEIVRRYGKPLGRYAAAIVGGRSEEVTQDAFSKALLALRGMEGDREIELRPWLYRIVRNTALNDLRDRPPEAAELAEAIEGGRSAAEEFERREEVSRLLERLRALPEPQRAAIVMRELEGLGHEEIADALGLSGGAARQAIYRARRALRDGVGMLVPLPLLRALVDHGSEAGVAAGAGAGSAAAGTALGGGGVLKVGAIAAAVLAGGVGTGIALKGHDHRHGTETATAALSRSAGPSTGAESPSGPLSPVTRSSGGDRDVAEFGNGGGDRGHDRARSDHGSGRGSGEDSEPGDGDGGRGPGGPAGGGGEDGHGGSREAAPAQPSEQSKGPGPGGGSSGGGGGGGGGGQGRDSGSGGSGSSGGSDDGSGGSGSGSGGGGSGSGGSGSGSGSPGGPPPQAPPPQSGEGTSGSSGSGSSSGSGGGSGGSDGSSGGSGGPGPG